jgi:hypothetical protein
MERGTTETFGQIHNLVFVVTGPATHSIVEAFKQGTRGEPGDRRYIVTGFRCSRCGLVEFYGNEEPIV